jgi:hypothetical protein
MTNGDNAGTFGMTLRHKNFAVNLASMNDAMGILNFLQITIPNLDAYRIYTAPPQTMIVRINAKIL